ncbi:MAG: CoA transferase [Pseudomonadota bacterium]
MGAPLDDVTIVEIDNWMAAPSACAIFADMGAQVIKVEPLSGDPMRNMSRPPKFAEPNEALQDYDFQFDVDNRGKRSIGVALDTDAGIEIVHRLVEQADVFVCNLLARRQQKFRLDAESLFKRNPRLVHATLTGYGTTGPEAWRPGYDITAFFGRSGLYDASREGDDGEVGWARPAQGDHTTGIALVAGVLAALRQAERTGEGQQVETSLFEAAIWTQASDYAVTAVDRAPVRRRARPNMLNITSNRFPCGDGNWVVFNMPEPSAWSKFARVIGLEDLIEDERFATPGDRYRAMPELVALVDAALAAKSRDEWGEVFDANGIIWGPVLGLHEVAIDPQAEAIGMFPSITGADAGTYRTVNAPMRFANAEVQPRGPAPVLGADTRDVLARAGFDAAAIDQLISDGVVIATR